MSAVQAAALVFVVAVLLWAGRLLAAALRSPRCRAPAPSDTTPAAGASLPLPSAAAGGAVLESIVVYPVKGCKGVEMREAKLTPLGLEHDREWMVVNAAGTRLAGKFVSQRQKGCAKLSLVEARVKDGALQLAAPGQKDLKVPLSYSGKSTEVTCWEWSGSALDCGDSAAAWFTSYLGAPVRLVRFAPRAARSCEAAYAPEHGSRFSDGYPLLAISAASVAALNADLGRAGEPPLKMNRFRPNLVLGGTPAYAEDTPEWRQFRVGLALLRAVKPCARCQVTTINQDTAEECLEPLRTMAAVRTGAQLGFEAAPGDTANFRTSVFMGMNLVVTEGAGCVLRVGDALRVGVR